MASSPDGEVGADDMFQLVVVLAIIPEPDCLVQGTSYDASASGAVPVNSVDLGCMRADGLDRLGRLSVVPNMQEPVMSRGKNMRILAIEFNLGGTRKPITKGKSRLSRPP